MMILRPPSDYLYFVRSETLNKQTLGDYKSKRPSIGI